MQVRAATRTRSRARLDRKQPGSATLTQRITSKPLMRMRHVVRRLVRMPMFTGMAVLTLAIAIGANAAIFSIVEGVLLKPLSYAHADELVVVDHAAPGWDLPSAGAAPFQYFTYRDEAR